MKRLFCLALIVAACSESPPVRLDPADEAAGACDCEPGEVTSRTCGSEVGACVAGVQERLCLPSCTFGPWGECGGDAVPASAEACGNAVDDDCDGALDEGCACAPAAVGESGAFWLPGPVFDLQPDPAGCRLFVLSGGADAELVVVDTANKLEVARVEVGQPSYDFDVAVDGSRVAFAAHDDVLGFTVVDVNNGFAVTHYPFGDEIRSLVVLKSGRVYYLSHSSLFRFDPGDAEPLRLLSAVGNLGELRLSPDEKYLYLASLGQTPGRVTRYAVLPDGALLREERTDHILLDGLGFYDRTFALSPDGSQMSFGGLLFDAHDFAVVRGGFDDTVTAIASTLDFGLLTGGTFDNRLLVGLGPEPTPARDSTLVSGDQEMWSYDPFTELLHYTNVGERLDPAYFGRREWPPLPLASYEFDRLIVDPRRPWLYGLDARRGEVVVIDQVSLTPIETILVGTTPTDLAIDPSGRYLYTGHYYTWAFARIDLDELAFDAMVPARTTVSEVLPLASGRLLTVDRFARKDALLFDPISGARVAESAGNGYYQPVVAASLDGTQVYLAESDLSSTCLHVFDASGDALTLLREHTWEQCVEYAKHGLVPIPGTTEVFWAGGRWRTSDLTEVYNMGVIPEYADVILTVTPDARLAVSSTKVYDAATGAQLGELPSPAPVQALAVDGKTLFVNGPDGIGVARVDLAGF